VADKDKDAEKKIKDAIKKEGNKVEPKDKDALAKIRQRTGAGKEGNGRGSGRGKK
jgi:hypothetical protein